jgi:hypothetical protein
MILFRIMDTAIYVLPSIGLVILFIAWSAFRLFKGISIIFDIVPFKVYSIGILIVITLCAALYGYLDYTYSSSLYFKFLLGTNNP